MSAMEYFPSNSILHKLDPRVKLIMLVLFTILVFFVRNFYALSVLFLFIMACWWTAKVPLTSLIGYFKLLIGLILFLVAVQSLLQPGETYIVKPLIPAFVPLFGGMGKITLEGFTWGLLLGFRLLVIMSLMPLIIMTTRIREFSLGLVKLGIPYKFAYMITTALNQVPNLQSEIKTIIDAQKLRAFSVFEEGSLADKIKAYPALVVPLVIGAMRKSMLVGVAMDVRAFGVNKNRTYIKDIQMKQGDWLFLAFVFALFIGLFLLSIWL